MAFCGLFISRSFSLPHFPIPLQFEECLFLESSGSIAESSFSEPTRFVSILDVCQNTCHSAFQQAALVLRLGVGELSLVGDSVDVRDTPSPPEFKLSPCLDLLKVHENFGFFLSSSPAVPKKNVPHLEFPGTANNPP